MDTRKTLPSDLSNDHWAHVHAHPDPQAGRPARQVCSEAWVKLAMFHLMARRLAKRLE